MSVSIDREAAQITADVIAAGSAERAASARDYLKSAMAFSGTAVPDVRRIITTWRRAHPDLTAAELTGLAAVLWDGPVFECKLAVIVLLADRRRHAGRARVLHPADKRDTLMAAHQARSAR